MEKEEEAGLLPFSWDIIKDLVNEAFGLTAMSGFDHMGRNYRPDDFRDRLSRQSNQHQRRAVLCRTPCSADLGLETINPFLFP